MKRIDFESIDPNRAGIWAQANYKCFIVLGLQELKQGARLPLALPRIRAQLAYAEFRPGTRRMIDER